MHLGCTVLKELSLLDKFWLTEKKKVSELIM